MFWRIQTKIDLEPETLEWRLVVLRQGESLRVIYVCDPKPDGVFVITAYTLEGQTTRGIQTTHEEETQMKKLNRFPKGWNEARVQEVLEHYESQTEDEALAEDEAVFRKRDYTVMVIPKDSYPQSQGS
jgi:hypothetical protein